MIILSIFIFILHTNYISSFLEIKTTVLPAHAACPSILLYLFCSLFEFYDGLEVTVGLLCICQCLCFVSHLENENLITVNTLSS